jgi:hypothetical protein
VLLSSALKAQNIIMADGYEKYKYEREWERLGERSR